MVGGHLVAVAGLRLGNNCCSGFVTVPIAPTLGRQHWFGTDGNGVQIATIGSRARVVTNAWMGCTTFWACAGGGESIVIGDTDGTRRVDVSTSFPRLLKADARFWRRQISPTLPARTSGWIA